MKRPASQYSIRILALIPFLCVSTCALRAQHVVGAKAGIIEFTQGEVFLENQRVILSRSSFLLAPLGQCVRTELGYAELLLGPHVYLRMGIFGQLRIEQNRLEDTQIALERGSALVEIVQEIKGNRTRIRLRNGVVDIEKKGLYRFYAGSGEVRVYGGSALVSLAVRQTTVKGGRTVFLDGSLAAKKFEEDEGDSLHKWSARRSFELFQFTQATRSQNHWQRLALGWAVNSDYKMRFFSERLLREWRQNQHVPLDIRIAMELEQQRLNEEREYLKQKAIRERQELEAAQNPGAKPIY
jgi:hypothetical protein